MGEADEVLEYRLGWRWLPLEIVGMPILVFVICYLLVAAIVLTGRVPDQPPWWVRLLFVYGVPSASVLGEAYLVRLHLRYRLIIGKDEIREIGALRTRAIRYINIASLRWYVNPTKAWPCLFIRSSTGKIRVSNIADRGPMIKPVEAALDAIARSRTGRIPLERVVSWRSERGFLECRES